MIKHYTNLFALANSLNLDIDKIVKVNGMFTTFDNDTNLPVLVKYRHIGDKYEVTELKYSYNRKDLTKELLSHV
jgi:hypothetical protein